MIRQAQTISTTDDGASTAVAEGSPEPSSTIKRETSAQDRANDQAIVQIRDLKKTFGSHVVLDGVSIDFHRGETTVLLGPSGTGKSVLLKHTVGLIQPDSGSVIFEGDDMCCLGLKQMVEKRKRIGFLFQMGALFDSLTIGENVAFALVEHTNMSKAQRHERVSQVLGLVGLEGVQKKMPAALSGGQRKRVALARAIVLEPCLVLFDEPTTGLDPIRSDVINELIVNLGQHTGITNIVVTHDIASANKIADRMLLLSEGGIVYDGTPEQFRESDNEQVQRFINGQADSEDLAQIREAFRISKQPAQTPA